WSAPGAPAPVPPARPGAARARGPVRRRGGRRPAPGGAPGGGGRWPAPSPPPVPDQSPYCPRARGQYGHRNHCGDGPSGAPREGGGRSPSSPALSPGHPDRRPASRPEGRRSPAPWERLPPAGEPGEDDSAEPDAAKGLCVRPRPLARRAGGAGPDAPAPRRRRSRGGGPVADRPIPAPPPDDPREQRGHIPQGDR